MLTLASQDYSTIYEGRLGAGQRQTDRDRQLDGQKTDRQAHTTMSDKQQTHKIKREASVTNKTNQWLNIMV